MIILYKLMCFTLNQLDIKKKKRKKKKILLTPIKILIVFCVKTTFT